VKPDVQEIAFVKPMVVGAVTFLLTIVIHALAVATTVNSVRRARRLGFFGRGFGVDVIVVVLVTLLALAAHLAEIALWAVLFMMLGEFSGFGSAYYHSAVNYTTLGYGDVIMSSSWRLLGALEAADGMLMFGVSIAIIFTVIQRQLQTRFVDLKT
jgi:voltage-gated potassium channel Kch